MNISELSIRRPVLSTVLTLIILLFGIIGTATSASENIRPWTIHIFGTLLLPGSNAVLLKTRLPNHWNKISMVFRVSVPCPASASRVHPVLR